MQIKVIKKKVSSYKELGHELIELERAETLKELLIKVSICEYHKQHASHQTKLLSDNDIRAQAKSGKVTFGDLYNKENGDLDKAIQVMIQDFQDGLFRVYINHEEYTDLNQRLSLHDQDELVLIRLVMLAGRLW